MADGRIMYRFVVTVFVPVTIVMFFVNDHTYVLPAKLFEYLERAKKVVRSFFSAGENVDSEIQASSKQAFLPFNQSEPFNTALSVHTGSKRNGEGDEKDDMPSPEFILYPEDKIILGWKNVQKIGAGLYNLGNTCFLNSVLQCLTHTAPLVNYCLSDDHAKTCKEDGFCMMCEMQKHVKQSYENSGTVIGPQTILENIDSIAYDMVWGRQEDAHEFLIYAIDAMQKACLNGYSELDAFSKETTAIGRIFGGYQRSQVQCLKCGERYNRYEPCVDISLEIKDVPTLEEALEKYIFPETLANDNAYMCTKCQQKVKAEKSFSIHKPSNILAVSLKRFDYQGKISQKTKFPEELNIRPYMSDRQGEKVMYQLYAVLVHAGTTCDSGHYFCYVKSPDLTWFCMNDSEVRQASSNQVLSSEAYILFYSRMTENNTVSDTSINKKSEDKNAVRGTNGSTTDNARKRKRSVLGAEGLSTAKVSRTDTIITRKRKNQDNSSQVKKQKLM